MSNEKTGFNYFLKYLILFTLLFVSIASLCLLEVLKVQSKPFFYINF